jgi:hypothetical protein
MKHGFRKPSLKKSIASRTVGKAKRELMKSIIPGYGTKSSSIFNPRKKAYNKIYSKTTFGINDIMNTTHRTYVKDTTSKSSTQTKKNISNKYSELEISNTDPNFSFYKTIVKEIDKLDKQTDIIKFFVSLKGISDYISKLKDFENMYNNYNHYLSEKLTMFMNKNKNKIINDFIDRNYKNIYEKILTLKTENSKNKNIERYLVLYNNFENELNEDNKTKIKQNYSNLLKLL